MERDFLEELLSKTDLVQLVSKYVSLERRGNDYWACCPFHHEKTPSFRVTAEKQLYYCYGCHEGGNAITFLKKMENIDGGEAVRILAEAADLPIPVSHGEKRDFALEKKKKERLLLLMRDTARHYHENLFRPEAKNVYEYAEKRGLVPMIRKFGLGCSLSRTEIIDFLLSKGYTQSEMKDAGVVGQSADTYYDCYANRLIVPIINSYGNVIGFGGRIPRSVSKDEDVRKYINTRNTELFDKSKTLFAINLVKKRKQEKGLDSIIITEGYMDTISLFKGGFDNVVASMGTSLTFEQAKLIKNYCNKVYISYDGDGAGQASTIRGLDILQSVGLNVKVVRLTGGKDPDDIINDQGASGYQKLLDEAMPLTAFKIENLASKYDMSEPDEKSKFAIEAIKIIKKLDNPVEQEEYLRQIHSLSGYSMQVLYKQAELTELSDSIAPPVIDEPKKEQPKNDLLTSAQEFLLASLINQKPYADFSVELFEFLSSDEAREAYNLARERYKNGFTLQSLYGRTNDAYAEYINRLINYEFVPGDDKKKFDECAKLLKIRNLERQRDELLKENRLSDPEFVKKFNELDKQLKQMKKNGGYNG